MNTADCSATITSGVKILAWMVGEEVVTARPADVVTEVVAVTGVVVVGVMAVIGTVAVSGKVVVKAAAAVSGFIRRGRLV